LANFQFVNYACFKKLNIWQTRRKPATQSQEAKAIRYASPAATLTVLILRLLIVVAFYFAKKIITLR